MSKIDKLTKSPLIHIALATGVSIIAMAYASKHILPRSIGNLLMALPPFLMSIHSAFSGRHNYRGIWKTEYWIITIFLTTALIIMFHLI